jgi:hypothetical protein
MDQVEAGQRAAELLHLPTLAQSAEVDDKEAGSL